MMIEADSPVGEMRDRQTQRDRRRGRRVELQIGHNIKMQLKMLSPGHGVDVRGTVRGASIRDVLQGRGTCVHDIVGVWHLGVSLLEPGRLFGSL